MIDQADTEIIAARIRYTIACREQRQAITRLEDATREVYAAREALKDALLREE